MRENKVETKENERNIKYKKKQSKDKKRCKR